MILTVVFAYAVGLLSVARALPNGAPLTSCGTIAPDPSGNGHQAASKSLASSPFNLNVTLLSRGYTGGTQYSLSLTGGSTRYQGLLIQARLASDMVTPAGTFTNLASSTQIGPCTPTGSSITHTNNNLKNNLLLRWTAPPVGTGNVIFLYTVVISLSNYYSTLSTAVIPELIGGTTGAPTNAAGTTAQAISNGGTWKTPWTVSAVSVVAVLGSIVGVVFLTINFVSLAFYLHKIF
ncbi:hypothetical protein EMCRGX_G004949 [Ephydatia muelleri]